MKFQKSDIYDMVSNLLGCEARNINEDESFVNYGMTSISSMELVVMLEAKYQFTVKNEDLLLEKLDTFSKLFSLLNSY